MTRFTAESVNLVTLPAAQPQHETDLAQCFITHLGLHGIMPIG
jgi:hypothetical protein